MKFYNFCYRIISSIVLIWVNFINTVFVMKNINTNRTFTFLNNKNYIGNLNLNSLPQTYLKKPITHITTEYKGKLDPFNQPAKEILSDLIEDRSQISDYYKNLKINNKEINSNKINMSNKTKKSIDKSISIEYECEPIRYIEAKPEDSNKLENFDKIWNAIVTMRESGDAPVDSMGAHCLADRKADIETQRFQYLVACLLSSQTKDKSTSEAVNNLRNSGLLSIDSILLASVEDLDKHISMVGFHNTKSKNLKKISQILKDKFGGKVPDNLNDLTSLPGIGPKMAHLILQLGFNKVEGIAVDVHVNRIVNRLGWVKTKTPEETRIELEKLIPKKFWAQLNVLLVGFGQMICTKAGPGCSTCLANSYCPVGRSLK